LYLTAANARTLVADCWLYNRVPSPTFEDVRARRSEYRSRGEPPPAPSEVTGSGGVHPTPIDARDVTFVWSADGESVAAWVGGELAGFIATGERRGHAAHLRVECPWGQPMDRGRYEKLFETKA
jgi:hypothetical protein